MEGEGGGEGEGGRKGGWRQLYTRSHPALNTSYTLMPVRPGSQKETNDSTGSLVIFNICRLI